MTKYSQGTIGVLSAFVGVWIANIPGTISAFGVGPRQNGHKTFSSCRQPTTLHAIGVLAKKAKEMELRKYVEDGVPDDVMAKYKDMKAALENLNSEEEKMGPLQTSLTKRKGTVTVIAEYKRNLEWGKISEIFEPDVLSSTFREFGAQAIAVLADERVGGCSYDDIIAVRKEQDTALRGVHPPIPIVSSDVIVDEIQLARGASVGVNAFLITMGVVGGEACQTLVNHVKALGMESIVSVATREEAQEAVNVGARMLCVASGSGDADEKWAIVDGLDVPEGGQVTTIAALTAKKEGLEEVEETWVLRDKGFNAVWASDCLYKAGNDPNEHCGSIIRAMRAKSSVQWASAAARTGKGEGAREYLGDIMM